LQGLPICNKTSAKAMGSFAAHHTYLAIAALEHGHCETITYDSRQFQVCCGSEYFTKLIEARTVTTITSATVKKFFWQQIICRFSLPK
jgi:hypothetical protein